MFGGYFAAGAGGTDPPDGSIGLQLTTGTRRASSDWWCKATRQARTSSPRGDEMHGPRFEFCNICLRIGAFADHFTLFGGSFVNSILTGGGSNIGIKVDTGATRVILMPTLIESTATPVSDAGKDTLYPFNAALRGT